MNDFLSLAYWKKANLRDVERDIEYVADINARDKNGNTALMRAAAFVDNPKIITTLLDEGADVHARDKHGYTPLMVASYNNANPDIVELLIDEGADVNAAEKSGETPLMLACNWNKNPKIILTLIDEGADVNAQNRLGETAWDLLRLYNPKLSKNKKLAALLQPSRRDSYRGGVGRTRFDRTRRSTRRYR